MRHRRGRQQIAQSAREGRRGSRAFRPPRARSAAVLARLRRVNARQSHIHRHLGGRHGARRGAVQRGAVRCSAAQRGLLVVGVGGRDDCQSCQKGRARQKHTSKGRNTRRAARCATLATGRHGPRRFFGCCCSDAAGVAAVGASVPLVRGLCAPHRCAFSQDGPGSGDVLFCIS